MSDNTNMIQFIDSEYRELFKIPDGGSIRIVYPPGDGRGSVTRECQYHDSHHFSIKGGDIYHICQFAEMMERIGAKCEPEVWLWGAELVPFAPGEEKYCTYNREEGNTCVGHLSGDFVPGLYLRDGYVITSRGCPNRCWFCSVPAREGGVLRELPVTNGWNVLDDNLLACSESHIHEVFAMLKRQEKRPVFTGGLEAALLRPWHVDLLRGVKAARMYFAYDTPDDLEPLIAAGKLLRDGGVTKASHRAACYVLIGYPTDTADAAEARLRAAWGAGFVPYAMLYRDETGAADAGWRRFQRAWVRPEIVLSQLKNEEAA